MFLYFLLFLFTTFLFYHFYWKRRNFPPGPIPLPFLGNLFQFGFYGVEEAAEKFKDTYGDLHTIWFGNTPVVSINDFPTIYETFFKNGDAFAGREHGTSFLKVTRGGDYGITLVDGPLWKEQRKFGLRVLRDLGMGKDVMQQKVLTEISYLLQEFQDDLDCNNKEINILDKIDRAIGSVINSVVLGYRFDKDHEHEFYAIKHAVAKIFNIFGHPLWRIMESGEGFYRYLPFFRSVFEEMKENCEIINKFIVQQINKHKRDMKFKPVDEEPNDYVEAFLIQQKILENEGAMDHFFVDDQLIGAAFDLWTAGQETTSTTLAWVMNYLTFYQNVQRKIHEELDRVIGCNRIVTIEDRSNLPYINAVIHEAQRYSIIAAFNLFHRTLEDVNIHGHKIPKNTIVINGLTVFKDKRYFENPNEFKPERFIDENGKFFSKPEMTPFGIGKRACLGEGLARMELFLFTANIFNQFKLTEIPSKPISSKRIFGGTITPEPFVVNIEPRW